MKLVHVVADYGAGDLAFSEMISALATHLPEEARWHTTPVESFNTLATGFIVGQLGLLEGVRSSLIYANCAPRQDALEERADNAGEGLLYGLLRNGTPILVVNSGWSLSFVREALDELWSLDIADHGSQFRSRDIFPKVVGQIMRGEKQMLKKRLDALQVVPEIPAARVAYIDSFGNLKTTFRSGDDFLQKLEAGQRLDVRINGVQRAVTVATGSFGVRQGDMAFAPGSSGHERRFWEVFQRGGSAAQTFGNPRVGAPIEIDW